MCTRDLLLIGISQGQTKRREATGSRAPKSSFFSSGRSRGGEGGQPQIKKATFEITKKKEVGVSDLTLLSKVSNEAINENLKKRFEHAEIYVRNCPMGSLHGSTC
jgi:myosin I